ncbi:FAD-dependent 5-carboxymethylaminomethyl-2-thiouridine(34) oxidoreductase MnmC [Hyphomonadaceae bacterium ML37]|nr:FAD-dependent 5-carboxymethylaminomethyl-2-thiouridine(34) oxidoreductase MnmC [Hyphomonadaceae bacterium ML37]
MASEPPILKRPHARLDWPSGPLARDHGDMYFQPEDGLAEARAVFVAGAGYPERFHGGVNVVGELGFGTGLNCLALWDSFRRHAPDGARLHIVSVEGFPLTRADAGRALALFPELASLAEALLDAWPSPHCGPHRRVFDNGRVCLTIHHDAVAHALDQMDFAADAWFLDGFAPAKNPDMWGEAVLARIARLCAPGARVATFTVAGAVRRGLAASGFDVAKRPGFGRKRERLEAVYAGPPRTPLARPFAPAGQIDGPVAIIGGGIAAASLADAFARRGRQVTVFADGAWGAGASGAPLGLLTPRLEAADRPHNRALLAAFDFAAQRYRQAGAFDGAGVLRLGGAERLQRLADALDDDFTWLEPSDTGLSTGWDAPGLFMARAGIFEPSRLLAALGGAAELRDARVAALEPGPDSVRLIGPDGGTLGEFAAVILAGGAAGRHLMAGQLPLEATAGQVAVFASAFAPASAAAWGGYAAAMQDGLMLGATHDKGDDPGEAARAEAALRALAQEGPAGLAQALGAVRDQWGGVRAAAADRLPAVGPLPDEAFSALWAPHAQGRAGVVPPQPGAGLSPRVFTLTGLGARGFAHGPLLAEAMVSQICGEPSPLERAALEALHPARLTWRALKRG